MATVAKSEIRTLSIESLDAIHRLTSNKAEGGYIKILEGGKELLNWERDDLGF